MSTQPENNAELEDDPGGEGRDNPAGPEREGHEEDEGGSA
jgi:hypothetical protein